MTSARSIRGPAPRRPRHRRRRSQASRSVVQGVAFECEIGKSAFEAQRSRRAWPREGLSATSCRPARSTWPAWPRACKRAHQPAQKVRVAVIPIGDHRVVEEREAGHAATPGAVLAAYSALVRAGHGRGVVALGGALASSVGQRRDPMRVPRPAIATGGAGRLGRRSGRSTRRHPRARDRTGYRSAAAHSRAARPAAAAAQTGRSEPATGTVWPCASQHRVRSARVKCPSWRIGSVTSKRPLDSGCAGHPPDRRSPGSQPRAASAARPMFLAASQARPASSVIGSFVC